MRRILFSGFLTCLFLASIVPRSYGFNDSTHFSSSGFFSFNLSPINQSFSLHGFNRNNSLSLGVGAFHTNNNGAKIAIGDSSDYSLNSVALIGGVNAFAKWHPVGLRANFAYHFPTKFIGDPHKNSNFDLKQLVTNYFGIYYRIEILRLGIGANGNVFTNQLGQVQSAVSPSFQLSFVF